MMQQKIGAARVSPGRIFLARIFRRYIEEKSRDVGRLALGDGIWGVTATKPPVPPVVKSPPPRPSTNCKRVTLGTAAEVSCNPPSSLVQGSSKHARQSRSSGRKRVSLGPSPVTRFLGSGVDAKCHPTTSQIEQLPRSCSQPTPPHFFIASWRCLTPAQLIHFGSVPITWAPPSRMPCNHEKRAPL
jgi:hypothetical protein